MDWLCKIKLNWEELLGQIDGNEVSDVNMVFDDRVQPMIDEFPESQIS